MKEISLPLTLILEALRRKELALPIKSLILKIDLISIVLLTLEMTLRVEFSIASVINREVEISIKVEFSTVEGTFVEGPLLKVLIEDIFILYSVLLDVIDSRKNLKLGGIVLLPEELALT